MKYNSLLIKTVACVVANIINHSLSAQYNTDAKKADFYLKLSKKYVPAAYEILKSDEPKTFLTYAGNEGTAKALLSNFGTVVHETCHGYNFKIAESGGWNYNGFFISENCKITARKENFFPSSFLNDVIPKEEQEKIFRYKTYVSGESNNSSSLQGVYGFLDEFCAYYHDTQACLELLLYFETICPYTDASCWIEQYLSPMQSTLYAYYEFRLFIAWYLIYAEQHEQKIFNELITNQNLRLAFTLLDNEFKLLVEDYFVKRNQVIEKLNAAGNKVFVDKEYIKTSKGNSTRGFGIPDERISYLKNLFTEKENAMLEKFGVKGANQSNYKSFLEKAK